MTTTQTTATLRPLDCPTCHTPPTVEVDDLPQRGWVAHCPGCYDGATDAGPQMVGHGATQAQAVDEWNEVVRESIADRKPCRVPLARLRGRALRRRVAHLRRYEDIQYGRPPVFDETVHVLNAARRNESDGKPRHVRQAARAARMKPVP